MSTPDQQQHPVRRDGLEPDGRRIDDLKLDDALLLRALGQLRRFAALHQLQVAGARDLVVAVQARELRLDLGHRIDQTLQVGDSRGALRRDPPAISASCTSTRFSSVSMPW